MFDKVLKAFILIIPLWYYGSGELLNLSHTVFFIGVIALFFIAMIEKPVRQVKLLYPSLFFLYCVVNFIYHNANPLFLSTFLDLAFGAMLFYLVINYSKDFKGILNTIKIVLIINILWIVLQKFQLDPIFDTNAQTQLSGFFERTSSLSSLFVMMLSFYPILIIPILCIPNYSGIFFGVTVLSLIAMEHWYRVRIVIPVLAILLIVGITMLKGSEIKAKIPVRKEMLFKTTQFAFLGSKDVADPFFGCGLGSFKHLNINGHWDIELKNEPIEWFLTTGFFGLIFAGLWITDIARRIWRCRGDPLVVKIGFSIIGILLMSLTQGVFQNVKITSVFLPILAWLYVITDERSCVSCS